MEIAKRVTAAHGGRNVRVLVPRSKGSPDDTGRPLFLVDLDEGRNLFDLVALTEDLGEALGAEVNVLTEGSLSPYLREAVLAEAIAL
ncbi:MAG TPA: hypothetical protein VLI94_11030 [Solirubrobacterales bacterium]|nr:hypothetical protein [Solirubrobacterales bacterium]